MYMMGQQTKWKEYLLPVEFIYNNSYHCSLSMTPYELFYYDFFYGIPYKTPLRWDRLDDKLRVGLEMLPEMEEKESYIRQILKEAQDNKRDIHRMDRIYEEGEYVFLWFKL